MGICDFTGLEEEAITKTLRPLGEYVAEVGMDKPFKDYSKDQVLTLMRVVIGNFSQNMRAGEKRLDDEVPY